jgi:peptidoglycan/xylan/chitin deacetylase (PgdA/CDA1 family)
MKPTLIVTFIFFFNLYSATACGDHVNKMLDQSSPLIHHSLINSAKFEDKQFPDTQTRYDRNNPNHRGMNPWRTTTLRGQRKLALTYDDGPHPTRTPKLLDILKSYNVKATFFAMGELVGRYPKIAQRIVDEGHILASHDWRHDNSNSESLQVFKKGLKSSIEVVRKHYPGPHTYYRFPYGAYANATGYHHLNAIRETSFDLFGENCINFAFWDIDTSDWVQGMDPKDIVETLWANIFGGKAWRFKTIRRDGRIQYIKEPYIINRPTEGGVVLMHDIHERTVLATKRFLSEASTHNIEFVLLKDVEEFEYQNLLCQLK